MMFRAHIQNGRVVSDDKIELPDGTPVRVVALPRASKKAAQKKTSRGKSSKARPRKSFAEAFSSLVGACDRLPKDAASRVDEYLYSNRRAGSA